MTIESQSRASLIVGDNVETEVAVDAERKMLTIELCDQEARQRVALTFFSPAGLARLLKALAAPEVADFALERCTECHCPEDDHQFGVDYTAYVQAYRGKGYVSTRDPNPCLSCIRCPRDGVTGVA